MSITVTSAWANGKLRDVRNIRSCMANVQIAPPRLWGLGIVLDVRLVSAGGSLRFRVGRARPFEGSFVAVDAVALEGRVLGPDCCAGAAEASGAILPVKFSKGGKSSSLLSGLVACLSSLERCDRFRGVHCLPVPEASWSSTIADLANM